VVEVDEIGVTVPTLKPLVVELSHPVTLPVLPLNVSDEGVLPIQIVCAFATVPATVAGSTVNVNGVDAPAQLFAVGITL